MRSPIEPPELDEATQRWVDERIAKLIDAMRALGIQEPAATAAAVPIEQIAEERAYRRVGGTTGGARAVTGHPSSESSTTPSSGTAGDVMTPNGPLVQSGDVWRDLDPRGGPRFRVVRVDPETTAIRRADCTPATLPSGSTSC
jgi:hypothetical protein